MFRFVQRHEQYSTNFAPIQQRRAKFFRELFVRQIKILAQHKSRNENAFRLCSGPTYSDIFQKTKQTKPRSQPATGILAKRPTEAALKPSRNFSGITKKRSTRSIGRRLSVGFPFDFQQPEKIFKQRRVFRRKQDPFAVVICLRRVVYSLDLFCIACSVLLEL